MQNPCKSFRKVIRLCLTVVMKFENALRIHTLIFAVISASDRVMLTAYTSNLLHGGLFPQVYTDAPPFWPSSFESLHSLLRANVSIRTISLRYDTIQFVCFLHVGFSEPIVITICLQQFNCSTDRYIMHDE